jgi:hypothetical protein
VRASLVVVIVVSALLSAGQAAAFRPGAGIHDAREQLAAIVLRIERRTAELEVAREELARTGVRLDVAAGRLAAVLGLRDGLDAELIILEARLDEAQAQLDTAAADLFMAADGAPAAGMIDAVLGSASLTELGDRIAYTSAVTDRAAAFARQTATVRAEVERRRAAADLLVGARAVLVGTLRSARDERAAAIAASRSALTALETERVAAVELVERLRARADGLAGVDLTGLRHALHGEESLTYGRWAELFLRVADAPACRSNLVVVVAWQAAEGTVAAWNPLATTHRMPGSTSFNGVGVQDFVSLRQGLRGTWETIRNGWDVYGYGAIVASLRSCARPMTTARAINASSWCPGCTGGMYVLNVVPHVDADLSTYLTI